MAGWRGPDDRCAYRQTFTPRGDLAVLADGRLLGRLRFEVPSEPLMIGVQARAANAAVDGAPSTDARWMVMGRDTLETGDLDRDGLAISDILLAYEIIEASGGLFDLGGIQVLPRVDARIASNQLKMYFEVYPSQDMLESPRPIAVRYTVRARRPEKFAFRDLLQPWNRSRWDSDPQPAVQATYRFVPGRVVEPQHLTIDLSVLERGPYELQVELDDPRTGEHATRVIPFVLMPESGT
jgi:hypothetical protein